jgi:hypothetical protein
MTVHTPVRGVKALRLCGRLMVICSGQGHHHHVVASLSKVDMNPDVPNPTLAIPSALS